MKIKTSALTGRALDWAVAMAIGAKPVAWEKRGKVLELPNRDYFVAADGYFYTFKPTTDWAQCGQLIEAYKVKSEHSEHIWYASCKRRMLALGRTPQIAICRAVVAAQLGDEVEIPDELVEKSQS
ncbi:phage protein NinX family protein [Xenorhabdus thuongxuanensis]|uniref:DUF2591 domain-containing protein n=1 Tax=Xenorhabdus thuongxuanensis TaxID=1873484 RepID=A0A1Q5U5P0_9GAMM|nr:phage protein NinX family protein [Xenorhabdus thuongxuanensis]OKP07786.1 hypothetical protein Xentx_01180 [Xenorhabdus thuongxuanensis]